MTWDGIGTATRAACDRDIKLKKLAGKRLVMDAAGAFYTAARRHAQRIFHGSARQADVVAVVTCALEKLLDKEIEVLVVLEGSERPPEKSQCNQERRDRRETARKQIIARRAVGLTTNLPYGDALVVPNWLGQGVAEWIEEQRSSGQKIGCIVAPLEADAQCAAFMRHPDFVDAYYLSIDNDTIAWATDKTKFLRPVDGTSLLDAIDKDEFELVDAARLLSGRYPLAIGAEATRLVEAAKEALRDGEPLPDGAYTFNGWTRDDLIFLLVVSGNVDYVRIYSPKLGKYVSKLSSIGIVAGVNLTEARRNRGIWVPGSPPSTRTESRGDEVLVELDERAVAELGVEPGEYTAAVEACVAVFDEQLVFMRHDDPRRFDSLTLGALRRDLVRSEPHLEALAERHGIDVADLTTLDATGKVNFMSPWAKCKIPGPLFGLMRPLHVEHVNIGWDGETATFLLGLRDLADGKFNIAEPHVASVTKTPGVQTFVDEYLDHGTLCFSEDDAERELFQVEMKPMSTAGRQEYLAKPIAERQKGELDFLKRSVVAGVVEPQTDEDRRRRDILHARHQRLTFVADSSGRAGRGSWTAVSRVQERKKEIGGWYDVTVLRRYGSGTNATFDVEFADDGYVAKGVASGDVRRGLDNKDQSMAPDVGATGKACYRGTKLDLDHVGLGWRREPVAKSKEYPDGLKWYRILGIRDLLDYDINRNLSGYEWAKNLDLLDYFANYYKNALCEVGGGGIKASEWVFKWTPAKGWAYGGFS